MPEDMKQCFTRMAKKFAMVKESQREIPQPPSMLALRHASLAQPHLGLPAAEAHRDGPTVWAGLNSKFVKNEIPQLDKELTGKLNDLDHHRKLLVKALKDELEGKNKPRPT